MSTGYLSDKPKIKDMHGKAWLNVQDLIGFGYRNCTRRIYFIRFERLDKDLSRGFRASAAKSAAERFFKTGVFDLNQCEPKDLMSRLGKLKDQVATQAWKECGDSPFVGLDIGFTYTGLDKMGVRQDLLEVFRKKNPVYYENAFFRAGKHLGDTGYSDPAQWASIYRDNGGKAIDLVLVVHFSQKSAALSASHNEALGAATANTELVLAFENVLLDQLFGQDEIRTKLEQDRKTAIKSLERSTVLRDVSWVEEAAPLSSGRVYFGYKDGLTTPTYVERGHLSAEGQPNKVYGHRTEHALGELLLGYPRTDGDNAYASLNLVHKANVDIQLQSVPVDDALKCFFKDSSFGVLRKMQQRTKVFDEWVKKQITPNASSETEAWIKAKMMGRTTEGRLLEASDTPATLSNTKLNTFNPALEKGFNEKDAKGEGCPFSSHIRRMNPRDDPVSPFIHRPLLRRGMPYTTETSSFGETEVGLSGLFFCADIAEQFEHLVGIWANQRVIGVPDSKDSRDPIIGNHGGDGGSKFKEPFVITRGCSYLWFPSVTTLDLLPSYFQS